MFNEYDCVRLTEDLTNDLKAGTRGTIVMIHEGPPVGYTVELFDDSGETIGVETVVDSQIKVDEHAS